MPSATSIDKPTAPTEVNDSSQDEQKEKKLSVLESHGYYLGKTIGSGSYATVRVAYSDRHKGNVAIKIVSKFSAPSDYLKKFLPREIDVVKGLKHSNLIRFLQAIETTHRVYIVMEYADNGSLLDIIRKDHYIDEVRSRKWFRQLVNAVDYCHERGVVHRDIKCENMLMDSGWNVKLSDFGFARAELTSKNGQIVLSETYCGSYAYASPEILRGIPYQPQHADIWSMGVVLYAMVFGKLPFDDSNYRELIKQVFIITICAAMPMQRKLTLLERIEIIKIIGDNTRSSREAAIEFNRRHQDRDAINHTTVSNKVAFPKDSKVSSSCRSLINQILAPLKVRIRVNGIRRDTWFTSDDDEPGTSHRKNSASSETEEADKDKSNRSSVDQKEIVAPHLITKEQLDAEGKPKDKRRRSTLEESTIITQEPEDAVVDGAAKEAVAKDATAKEAAAKDAKHVAQSTATHRVIPLKKDGKK